MDVLPAPVVVVQLEAVVADLKVLSAKTGMLANQEIIAAVAKQIEVLGLTELVVDPVMVSRTGAQLIDNWAVTLLRDALIPLAKIVTPNRYEAQILSGLEINSQDDMKAAAEKIYKLAGKLGRAPAVLVKGGGMTGKNRGVDVWFDGQRLEVLKTEAVDTNNTHGTGCTLSAAIAANLALGKDPRTAVSLAKDYVSSALKYSLNIGRGVGPVGHFFPLLER